MKELSYIEFINKQAECVIKEIEENGCVSGGINGPYGDEETPLRLSAHWICIFSWLYNNSKMIEYIRYIKKLADYICLQVIKVKEEIYVFCSRNKEGMDHVNGTIGSAWIIEGLIQAAKVLKDEKYYNLAIKVFLSFPFNEKIGCWNRYEIDGTLLGYDETFNHQVWLAASGSEIIGYKDNKKIREQIECFLDKLVAKKLFRIYKDGLIRHHSYMSNNLIYKIIFWKNHYMTNYLKNIRYRHKEEGYHYFSLYGLAILKNEFGEHELFRSKKIDKTIKYALDSKNYMRQITSKTEDNKEKNKSDNNENINAYCFPYNSPAFELPYIIKQFKPQMFDFDLINKLWEIQKETTMDKRGNLTVNVHDTKTLTARIYELLRAI